MIHINVLEFARLYKEELYLDDVPIFGMQLWAICYMIYQLQELEDYARRRRRSVLYLISEILILDMACVTIFDCFIRSKERIVLMQMIKSPFEQ